MQTVLPPNASAFFKTLFSIVMFDILSLFWVWEDHPSFIKADEIKQ